jgi:excisionase family DNA binding protein
MNLVKTPASSPNGPVSDLMRLRGVAIYLGCSVPTIYRLMAKGGLPARRLGGCWVFEKSLVDAWKHGLPGINLPTTSQVS